MKMILNGGKPDYFKLVFDSRRYTKLQKQRPSMDTAIDKNGVVPTKLGGSLNGLDLLWNRYIQFFKYVALFFSQFCVL